MSRRVCLRISGQAHEKLRSLLLPADGCEVVCIAFCGRHSAVGNEVLCVHEVHPVPGHEYTERTEGRASWRTDWLIPLLSRAAARGWAVVKIHSHPSGYASFSELDDESDRQLFPSIHGWIDDVPVHCSVVMLPDGRMFGRAVTETGAFAPLDRILVAGDLVQIWDESSTDRSLPLWMTRNAQALGSGTASLMGRLAIGVVGCSGTGSFVTELLARLGVGELVLVDPDKVGEENLNRLIWAYRRDVGRFKVEVAAEHIREIGLGTRVVPLATDLASVEAVRALAACDVVFGCVDSHDGRRLLNRLASFYVLPYFDCGVRLDADGEGGLSHISGAVHYVQPGRSSLLSRGVIDNERATAEARRRADPEGYERVRAEGYLRGLPAGQAAVASINGTFASMAVTELLARVHGFREDNGAYATQRLVIHDPYYEPEGEGVSCESFGRHVGRADVKPLLDMPRFSESQPSP